MAWNTNDQGVPYYGKPVEPDVPVAPREPPGERIGSSLLSAMVQGALGRERAQIEREQMVQHADLAAQELQLRRDKMGQDFDLSKKELALKSTLYDAHQVNAATNATRAETALSRTLQLSRDRAEVEQQVTKLNSDVDGRAKELGLTDPSFQTKDPLGFAAGIQKIKSEFPNAPLYTGIPDRFKGWQTIADQQTIPIKYGAVYDDNKKAWSGGETRVKPIWQVYRDLHNPETQDTTIQALAAAGHLGSEPSAPTPVSGTLKDTKWYERSSFSQDVPTTTTTWDKLVSNLIKQGDKADWTPGVSRMPTFVPKGTREQAAKYGDTIYDPRTTAAGRASPQDSFAAGNTVGDQAPLPEPDLPPSTVSASEPTQSDVLLQQARRAASMPNANVDGIKGWLQKNNIDPAQL